MVLSSAKDTHHNKAREHVGISHLTGSAAQLQGKQATERDPNSRMQHPMNPVSPTGIVSMLLFLHVSNCIRDTSTKTRY